MEVLDISLVACTLKDYLKLKRIQLMLNQLKRKLLEVLNLEKKPKKHKYEPKILDRVYLILKNSYFPDQKLTEEQEILLFDVSEKVANALKLACSEEINHLFLEIMETKALENYGKIFQTCLGVYEDDMLKLIEMSILEEEEQGSDSIILH